MISRAQSSLLAAEQKTKKKKKEDKISVSKQFTDSSMWLAFDKLHICTAPFNPQRVIATYGITLYFFVPICKEAHRCMES